LMLISHPKMVYRDRGQKNSEVGIRKVETIAKSRFIFENTDEGYLYGDSRT